jgi:hypothetical protein
LAVQTAFRRLGGAEEHENFMDGFGEDFPLVNGTPSEQFIVTAEFLVVFPSVYKISALTISIDNVNNINKNLCNLLILRGRGYVADLVPVSIVYL